jgi:hypothetical protein
MQLYGPKSVTIFAATIIIGISTVYGLEMAKVRSTWAKIASGFAGGITKSHVSV